MKKGFYLLLAALIVAGAGIVFLQKPIPQKLIHEPTPLSQVDSMVTSPPDTIYVGNTISSIQPPIKGLEIPYQTFKINLNRANLLHLPSGTEIRIPANSFVNTRGEQSKGSATIRYREFHNAAEIFVAGIPMEILHNNKIGHLTTAGMFDIRAENKEGILLLSNGKKITITMDSKTKGRNFGTYYFAENTKGWIYTGNETLRPDPELAQILNTKEVLKDEMIKIPLGDEYFVMNYNAIVDVMFADNSEELNKRGKNPAVGQKAKDYGFQWYDIWSGDIVNFEGTPYPAPMMLWKYHEGVRIPEWTSESSVVVRVKPTHEKSVYHLTMTSKERDFDVYAEAVMPLKSLFVYPPEFWKNNYEEAMANIRNEEIRIQNEGKILRSMEIMQMGIHNFDKILKEDGALIVKADFQFPPNMATGFKPEMVYYIPDDNRTIIKLPRTDWESVALLPGKSARIITVLPDQSIGYFNGNRYRKIPIDSIKRLVEPAYNFVFAPTKMKANSLNDVKAILGI